MDCPGCFGPTLVLGLRAGSGGKVREWDISRAYRENFREVLRSGTWKLATAR